MIDIEFYLKFEEAWYKLAPFTTVEQTKDYRTRTTTFTVRFFLNGCKEQVKETVTNEQINSDKTLLNTVLKRVYLEFLDKVTSSVI